MIAPIVDRDLRIYVEQDILPLGYVHMLPEASKVIWAEASK